MKWHNVPNQGGMDEPQDDLEFRNLGPLGSITREPPQNSRDNVLDDGAPVEMRYNIVHNDFDSEQISRYFPKTDWLDHVSLPMVKKKLDVDGEILAALNGGFKSMIIEDYNTTGLEGDVNRIFPDVDTAGNFTKVFMKNTWFWFMRSKGVERPSNRGGSWGLGKLAFPLASKIRTFFVVSTRADGSRFLAGQSILSPHERHGTWYESPLFFAAKGLADENLSRSWLPIEDDDQINQFCADFGVDRPADKPGTSFVIVMPKDELLDEGQLVVSLLANYLRPVSEGKLALTVPSFTFKKANLGTALKSIPSVAWESVNKNLSSGHGNPSRTTQHQANDLMMMSRTLSVGVEEQDFDLILKTPDSGAPVIDTVMPEKLSEEVKSASLKFHENKCVLIHGEIPITNTKGEEELGTYTIALLKHEAERADTARSYCYRDHIYVAHAYGVNETHKSRTPGVSSLLVVEGKENPLAGLLRAAEGPAHLSWASGARIANSFEHGQKVINFLKKLHEKIVWLLSVEDKEAEALWAHLFSKGNHTDPPEIWRLFQIEENDEDGGFVLTRSPEFDHEATVGKSFVLRVGYPKPFDLNVKKAPDARAIDVHEMTWDTHHANVHMDVEAKNGEICKDRVRVFFEDVGFQVTLTGLDREKNAQVIATPFEDDESIKRGGTE